MLYINTTMLGAGGGICHRVGQADSKTAPDGGGGVEADGPPSPPSKSSRVLRETTSQKLHTRPTRELRRQRASLLGRGTETEADAKEAPGRPGRRARRPVPPRCREGSRPATGGRGGRGGGLRPVGGVQPRPRVRLPAAAPGPGRRGPTHRKGPDPHLGVLPAARAFAQIRHGARPLPGGGGGGGCCGSHSEAPVSH